MIVYLDTSSLVKLYFEEKGSEDVVSLIGEALSTSTSWIAYTETRSAFARKYRERAMTPAQYEALVHKFEEEWITLTAIEASAQLLREAGDLAYKHGLRAIGAIHLASALTVRGDSGSSLPVVVFASADLRLLRAGEAEGLNIA